MDKIAIYRQHILDILTEYAKIKYANLPDAQNYLIADKERDRYQVLTIGWEEHKRVYGCSIHIDIIDGKIWIQNDRTEKSVAKMLVELGVPKSDIVLAYYPPIMQEALGYAVV